MVLAFWPTFDVNFLPPIVEPLWGNVLTAFVVHSSVPGPNAAVLFPVVVPNAGELVDRAVSLQVLQLDPPNVRASAVVRGLVR